MVTNDERLNVYALYRRNRVFFWGLACPQGAGVLNRGPRTVVRPKKVHLSMVTDFPFLLQSMAWPLVLLLAWFLGERFYELWHIPRVSSYVAVGLLGGLLNLPGLTGDVPGLPFLEIGRASCRETV